MMASRGSVRSTRARRSPLLLLLALVVELSIAAIPAGGQTGPGDEPPLVLPYLAEVVADAPPAWTLEELLGEPVDLHPRLQDSPLLRGVGSGVIDVLDTRFDEVWEAERRIEELEADLVIMRARISGSARRVDALARARGEAIATREDAEEQLSGFAVASFLGGELEGLDRRPDGAPSTRPVLTRDAGLSLVDELLAARDAEVAVDAALSEGRRSLQDLERAALAIDQTRIGVVERVEGLREEIVQLRTAVGDELFRAPLDGGGLTPRAVSAYLTAADEAPNVSAGCSPTWWQLAGIGRIESRHGTFGGAELQLDGTPSIPIIGPRLDGVIFASIGDSDGGRYDGDTEWDRAVGPMQFIPQSWERYGADADGDGEINPQDLDDAALAAARHLCGSVPGMSTPEQYAVALFGYNNSAQYVLDVQAEAEAVRLLDELLG